MIKKIFSITLLIVLAALLGTGERALQAREKKSVRKLIKLLDHKYQTWLIHVKYIITDTEKRVFFKLKNNRERDSFIELFWNLRDPSKGTPSNEYKEEHMKRFNHANRYFKYSSPLPGWKTDRGRIWILLGEPVTRNEIIESNGLYPVEIWEYFGGAKVGLPTMFRMVFYKRNGSGDFKLYIPSVDGPGALLRSEIGQIDPTDYYKIYQSIKEIEPQVAEVCMSLIPGESMATMSPSLAAPILISKIYELPGRRINSTYARNFLNYKGYVETKVITGYIDISTDFYVLRDPIQKLNFVHFAIRPERISVDYIAEKDQYYFNYDMLVILKKGDDTVFKYTKKYPFYYDKQQLQETLSHGLILTDYFPVIDGDFNFIILLQNSLNKEISYVETRLNSKSYSLDANGPQLYGPIVSYQIIRGNKPVYTAFSVIDAHVKVDPKRSFGQNDTLSSFFTVDRGDYKKQFQVELEILSLDESRKYKKIYRFPFTEADRYKAFTPQLEKLNYGNYLATARLIGADKKVLVSREKDFQVSPSPIVPHPPLAGKKLAKRHNYLFLMMVGRQYANIKDDAAAEMHYELAYKMNSGFPPLLKTYASLLIKLKKYDKLLEVIKNLETQPKELFNYYTLKGRAFYYKNNFQLAVDSLLKANKIYDSDVAVLNTLGLSLIRLGNEEEAEKALTASLKVNDNQPDIAKVLQQLKKNKKKEGT